MKKYITILLAAVLFAVSSAAHARAEGDYRLIGDTDGDGRLSILDATELQRSLAGLCELSAVESYLSDVDGSGRANILDAALMQRKLAGMGERFYKEKMYIWSAHIDAVTPNMSGAKVVVGSTLDFTAVEQEREIPPRYELYVDGMLRRELSDDNTFSYTFEATGPYMLSVVSYDPFGGSDVYTFQVDVCSGVESAPEITSLTYDKANELVRVSASGGEAPYEYEYVIRNNITPPPPEVTYESRFALQTDENGEYFLKCPFTYDDEVYVPVYMLTKTLRYYCEVQVRDASGALSDVKRVQIVF